MANKLDLRQSIYRGALSQIALGNTPEGDNLLNAINNQLTPLLRMSASSTPDLVVTIGGGDLTDSETNRRRAIPHVGTAYVQFSSGTVTFPAASGGNIVSSPGTNTVLTVGVGNYAAVLIYLDGSGNLNTIAGADSAVLNTAITNLPPSPDETLPLGFVVVQNVGGVIQNITQANIAQFGTGAGGGGAGNASTLDIVLRDRFANLGMKYLDPNIFRTAKTTKVDGASTGAFDLVKNAFKFNAAAQTMISTNAANAEFLAEGVDITEVEFYVHWLLGFIDTAATYAVSRDGGTNWSTVTMSRVGTDSNAYRGYHVFADETVQQALQTVAASGAGDTLNATGNQQLSSQFVVSTTSVLRQVQLQLNYGAAGVGTFKLQLVKNNAGVPSTALADLLAESNNITINTLSSGNITVTVDMPDTVLIPGTYHLVMSTDAAYKAGTMDLSWRSGAGTNGASYNGTSWTGSASTKAYTAEGRTHDLRVRVTAGAANTYLEGYGLYFGADDGLTAPNGSKNVQRFYFSGDENKTVFTLNWTPDPDLLEIYDPYRGQVYMIEEGVARISGQTVTFDNNIFNFPGEDIVLVFKQVKGIAIDNSDANAAKNSEQDTNLLDIGNQIEELDYVSIPKISVPNTQIVNRAQIIDLSQDLNARMGVNRIQTQQLARVQNEFGPNGEPVFRVVNDRFDQLRFVGNWTNYNANGGAGFQTSSSTDFCEITFYGTGLNLLGFFNSSTNITASVNGGAPSANIVPFTGSGVLTFRNYAANQIVNAVSNLTPGLHTVRLNFVTSSGQVFFGFEILNETQNLRIRPGLQLVKGKARTLSVEDQEAFSSGFELGTLGTRGGRVVVYQKADGSIAKAVTPTDATQLNLASANHANEEVVRVYNFREFGANRADDFSTLAATASNRAFTLDDGTTTLVGLSAGVTSFSSIESLVAADSAATTDYTFTFVGTGLDVTLFELGSATTKVTNVFIDGTNVGQINKVLDGRSKVVKIVSGLPYGTHTVRFNIPAAAGQSSPHNIQNFIVYQPKTPSIPAGAKAIAAYNDMADFAANTTAGVDTIATGVLRKTSLRELVYVNGTGGTSDWASTLTVGTFINGTQVASDRLNAYVEYTFFGTGFESRFAAASNRSANITVSLQSLSTSGSLLAATTSNFPTLASSVYGTGVTFNSGTGVLDQNDAATTSGSGLRISNLPLGLWKVRFNNNAAGSFLSLDAIDIITPIHSPKSNLYSAAQNTLPIGSQAIEDLRKLKPLEQVTDQKAVSQAVGVQSGPSTSSTAFVPCPDMSVTHFSKTGRLKVSWSLAGQTVTNGARLVVYLNGQAVSPEASFNTSTGAINAGSVAVFCPLGINKIDLYWRMLGAGTVTAFGLERILTVEDA